MHFKRLLSALITTGLLAASVPAMAAEEAHHSEIASPTVMPMQSDYVYHGHHYRYHYKGKYYNHHAMKDGRWRYY